MPVTVLSAKQKMVNTFYELRLQQKHSDLWWVKDVFHHWVRIFCAPNMHIVTIDPYHKCESTPYHKKQVYQQFHHPLAFLGIPHKTNI